MSQALLNTLIYTVGVIPFALVIPLAIAIATDNIGNRSRTLIERLFLCR